MLQLPLLPESLALTLYIHGHGHAHTVLSSSFIRHA